jgi:hypothetical protein
VVGLGTQKSHGDAEDFTKTDGARSFTMLWDESFETWQTIGITSQPSALLLTAEGDPITGWVGPFPEDEVGRKHFGGRCRPVTSMVRR